ncbi:NAD-binding protein [Nodosilinea sp. LEGE 07298]|uniref:NAD-binding protein n=1 Tax=Nodosilinea sp. LEGE 07298 TaxID=2777970 RepID=UPI00187E450C|nr:NAD-binding protein [Nodosilinea sp. LEGE 07298]MBE9113686.1 NAD-binding protein [Nodosilinea sp. LEGE 07298]
MTVMPTLKRKLRQRLIALTVALTLAGVVGLLVWQEGRGADGTAPEEVLENIVITLMGEYPDKPKSPVGRVLQLLLLVSGTFIFGAISGRISALFVTRALRSETHVSVFQNHIIICNWNDKAAGIIDQLLEGNKNSPIDIVVVAASAVADFGADIRSRAVPSRYTNPKDFPDRVHFVQDDPTHHATLERLCAPQAKAVILLADEDTEAPDEKNALIALAIKHLERLPGLQTDIHVIAELVNLSRRRHLQEAGVDEVVSARDYSAGIMAQSAMFKNMSVVYQQLLTYSDDSNEFYFIDPGRYPSHLEGKTFAELSHWVSTYSATHQADNPLLLLGVRRGSGEILLNPKPQSFACLATDDALVVMAFRKVDQIN